MDQAREIIELYNVEIIMALSAAFFLVLALYLIGEIRISKLKKRYDALVRGSDEINMEEVLLKSGYEIDKLKEDTYNMNRELNLIAKKLDYSIQKVGFIRYDAFADMGSELSFSIAFLNDFSNGFILSSIYGRESSICYAKPIEDGKSIYPLSAEEIQAIDRAIKGQEYSKTY